LQVDGEFDFAGVAKFVDQFFDLLRMEQFHVAEIVDQGFELLYIYDLVGF
jgi:hypothetical protein